MTNDRVHLHDIFKCPKCSDGYMIVKKSQKTEDYFYGCTNFTNEDAKCGCMLPIKL